MFTITPSSFVSTPGFAAPKAEAAVEHHGQWSPYQLNGGTVVAVCGADYCVVGGDTRMSTGYSILCRDVPKCVKLSNTAVLASAGMQADAVTLHKNLKARMVWYEHQNGKQMSTPALAQMLGNTLYHKRFFPYYAFNVLGGVDADGRGCVYSYDAIGSHERCTYAASGSGSILVQPSLDSQVGFKHRKLDSKEIPLLSQSEAIALVKDVFSSATERDIYTGDQLELWVITKTGAERQLVQLRKD
eukprot:TRINITY_DN8_c0_g1_i1.p1 TRINITY_DN8_c0_g1~~TRINITY_DN8_c0_g1_i1.p1  ORF type:complete len:244 (-),score=61.74 TRINITY_DN8_c0_g1_i1:65-796(-)